MNIRFDEAFWREQALDRMRPIVSPLGPVTKIHCWRRGNEGTSARGWVAVHGFHCIYICLKGEGQIEIDAVPYHIKENEAVGVLPHHPHRRLKADSPVQYLLLRFEPVDPDLLLPLFNTTIQLKKKLEPLIQDIVSAYEKVRDPDDGIAGSDLGLRIGLLLNMLLTCVKRELIAASPANPRLTEIMHTLLAPENIGLSLKEIAFKLGITPGHLTDFVHDAMGYSPRNIQQMIRHHTAIECLLHTTLSISQVAERSGFRSVYAFSRFFTRVAGMSPTAFRRKYGKTPAD
ncbi:MAG: AraC family transcriptional regulator [Lentisphaeria bacterium]|nr:AraC family transcriptional regulator [Lentisphaeria bacterium]